MQNLADDNSLIPTARGAGIAVCGSSPASLDELRAGSQRDFGKAYSSVGAPCPPQSTGTLPNRCRTIRRLFPFLARHFVGAANKAAQSGNRKAQGWSRLGCLLYSGGKTATFKDDGQYHG
jgi:hypothetical protein